MEVAKVINIIQNNEFNTDQITFGVSRTSPENIMAIRIIKHSPITFDNTPNHLKTLLLLLYGIYDNPTMISNENTELSCWLCDRVGNNKEILRYNTILGNNINLHIKCNEIFKEPQNIYEKKTISGYNYAYLGVCEQLIIYDMSSFFVTEVYNYASLNYNLFHNDDTNVWIFECNNGNTFNSQSTYSIIRSNDHDPLGKLSSLYINLVKKEFIDLYFYRLLLIREFPLDDAMLIIKLLYVKSTLTISESK